MHSQTDSLHGQLGTLKPRISLKVPFLRHMGLHNRIQGRAPDRPELDLPREVLRPCAPKVRGVKTCAGLIDTPDLISYRRRVQIMTKPSSHGGDQKHKR